MPPNRLATSGGQRRRCSTVPRFPADAAVIVAGRTRGASVLRPRRRSAEQRLASLESNGAQCILQCLTMAIRLRHVFSRRPLTEITPLSGHVSKMSWFWQDLRAVYPKSSANRCLGIHIVKILPGRASFLARGLQIMHSKLILPSCLPKPRKIASA